MAIGFTWFVHHNFHRFCLHIQRSRHSQLSAEKRREMWAWCQATCVCVCVVCVKQMYTTLLLTRSIRNALVCLLSICKLPLGSRGEHFRSRNGTAMMIIRSGMSDNNKNKNNKKYVSYQIMRCECGLFRIESGCNAIWSNWRNFSVLSSFLFFCGTGGVCVTHGFAIIIRILLIAFGLSRKRRAMSMLVITARRRKNSQHSCYRGRWLGFFLHVERPAIIIIRYHSLNIIVMQGVYQICYIAHGKMSVTLAQPTTRTYCKLNIFHFHLSVCGVWWMLFNAHIYIYILAAVIHCRWFDYLILRHRSLYPGTLYRCSRTQSVFVNRWTLCPR